jgi:hypothetical protein
VAPGVYATGWAKTGPVGIVDSTLRTSIQTIALINEDLESGTISAKSTSLDALIPERATCYADWLKVDEHELAQGHAAGKLREKVNSIEKMLAIMGKS